MTLTEHQLTSANAFRVPVDLQQHEQWRQHQTCLNWGEKLTRMSSYCWMFYTWLDISVKKSSVSGYVFVFTPFLVFFTGLMLSFFKEIVHVNGWSACKPPNQIKNICCSFDTCTICVRSLIIWEHDKARVWLLCSMKSVTTKLSYQINIVENAAQYLPGVKV